MTNLVAHITRRLTLPVFLSAVIFCAIIVSGSSVRMPMVSAASTPQILISPSSANLSLGQTFTITINLTDFPNLFCYQVVFKYSGTVLNLTNLWFPDDNVFSGHNPISVWSNDTEAPGDLVDNLNYTVAGSTLMAPASVSVSNGVLCAANFTVVGVGQTTIEIATKNHPAIEEGATWYTYIEDPSQTEFDFESSTSSVIVVPEFTSIVLVMTLAILGTAVLITRKKRALLHERRTVYTDHAI
jgi:hypothetical protein